MNITLPNEMYTNFWTLMEANMYTTWLQHWKYIPLAFVSDTEILMHLRALKKCRGEVSLYDPVGVDKEGNEITLIDVLGTEQDITEAIESKYERKRVLEKIKSLSKREIKVLQMRYGLLGGFGKTQREIAKRMGISRSYVSRIEKKALQKLLKELQVEGR
nr:sigma-70 family RNA polymerase sigma factor [Thermanaeromonas toyohensis]